MTEWREELEALHEQVVGLMTDGTHLLKVGPEGWTLQHPIRCRPDMFACPVNQLMMRGILVRDEDGEYMASINEEVADGLYLLSDGVSGADYYHPEDGRWVEIPAPVDPVTDGLDKVLLTIERLVRAAEFGD